MITEIHDLRDNVNFVSGTIARAQEHASEQADDVTDLAFPRTVGGNVTVHEFGGFLEIVERLIVELANGREEVLRQADKQSHSRLSVLSPHATLAPPYAPDRALRNCALLKYHEGNGFVALSPSHSFCNIHHGLRTLYKLR